VADIVLVPQSTLTRAAARMVQAGLLLRADDAQDRPSPASASAPRD
jgi:DNA-binding MarR family transcriptional regulator